jgi:hypothetical protein
MNKLLAYEFAAWLDPNLKIFIYQVFDKAVNERIRTLELENGYLSNREDRADLYPRKRR